MSKTEQKQDPKKKQTLEEIELIFQEMEKSPCNLSKPKAKIGRTALALATFLGCTALVDFSYVSQGITGVSELLPPSTNGVGDIIHGLTAKESQITGILDPETLTSSYYWTYIVHNSSSEQQEARISVKLPDGAAVSRATLWINGVPQEAAFNTKAKVEHAYNWITRQHRDPLLVTESSPGHILIHAAPVMPGRDMQLRLGITAIGSISGSRTQFKLPIVEQANMDIACKQNVHLESPSCLYSNNVLVQTQSTGTGYLAKGSVPASDLKELEIGTTSTWSRGGSFATRATHSSPSAYIVAKVEPNSSGASQILLTKAIDRAEVILGASDAAHRLSTLWAYAEIERLNSIGAFDQACELANVYRVVSSVSGATVLENENDYRHENLERNIYSTLSYLPPGFVNPAAKYESQPTPSLATTPLYKYSQFGVPINRAPSLMFPYGSLVMRAVAEEINRSLSSINSQLNRLNAVNVGGGSMQFNSASNWQSSQFSGLAEQSTYVSLSTESLARSSASGEEKLRQLCTEINTTACFSGAFGNTLATGLVGDSNNFNYLSGSGELPYQIIQAFETPVHIAYSALAIAIITLLMMANFAGSISILLKTLTSENRLLDYIKAFAWFFTAIIIPDLSLLILLISLSTKLSYQDPALDSYLTRPERSE
jgi:hypothetical protein